MKTLFLAALLSLSTLVLAQQQDPATKLRATDLSYRQLDSVIRMHNWTAIYFWPNWCTACKLKIPQLVEMMRQYLQVTFLSVNDPSSKPELNRKLLDHPGIIQGHYRIENQGKQKLIAINDRSQFKYFNNYYTKSTGPPTSVDYFYVFDRNGVLVNSYSGIGFSVDTVAAGLKNPLLCLNRI